VGLSVGQGWITLSIKPLTLRRKRRSNMRAGKNSAYTDSVGRYRTKSLFVEMILKEQLDHGIKPMYTLKGRPGYKDMHDIYLECDDPTEYTFAIRCFGTWKHFQYIASHCAWFEKYLVEWREEQEIRMRSSALRTIVEVASTADPKNVTAAKYIADKGYDKKRGRPSKVEVQREKRIQAGIHEDVSSDAKRLGLH